MQKRIVFTTAVILGLVLALATGALAQIRFLADPIGRLGPINTYTPSPDGGNTPATGNNFPEWIEDNSAPPIRLDLPVKPYGDGVNAPTMIFDPPITGNQLSQDTGFGAEAFYFLANSTMTLSNGSRATLDLGIEAAYGAGDPLAGDEFLFARVRVRFQPTAAGTYTVTHPWGTETLEVTAADVGGRFNYVNDFGGFAPLCADQTSCFVFGISESPGFERILVSPKEWRFLIPAVKVTNPGQEDYILGDGVTATTVTNGVNGVNTFSITGPATGTTDQFTVSGHIAGQPIPTPVTTNPPPPQQQTDVVTIVRARLKGNAVEVRATSSNGFAMTGELLRNGVVVGSANLGTSGRGNISFTGANPDTARVHSTSTNPNILGGVATAPITN